jgi:hypothetical protein
MVEHEDNEMMLPHCFGSVDYTNPKTGQPMCPTGVSHRQDGGGGMQAPLDTWLSEDTPVH